ncbi:E3 ubiquitin-protein ligase BRE1-like 1 [Aristolochia californica]|uniref:E3 ubiquitin-protein ligase BRE1-like 1 n=1 Tax=Aristolochia californica TaxID=171875 RepID=UPI0035DA9549
MGSTGEPDRKRRHFNSISPTAAAAKKLPFLPVSEDKKLDTTVLQYQNQKLVQQLETQKVEYFLLEDKFHQLKDKQQAYDETLKVVNKSWKKLVDDLDSVSFRTKGSVNGVRGVKHSKILDGQPSCSVEETFLSRLLETGATHSCSVGSSPDKVQDDGTSHAATKGVLQNLLTAINGVLLESDVLSARVFGVVPKDESTRKMEKTINDLEMEVRNLRMALSDLHLKHRSLGNEVQRYRDTNAKNKAQLKLLTGELESTIAELEESNHKLATLKAQKDAPRGSYFPILNLGSKFVAAKKARDKEKDLQDLESSLKELLNLTSSRLLELSNMHEERIEILKKLASLRSTLKDVKSISSSKIFVLLKDQIEKSKDEVAQYRVALEKLQVEKDNFIWWEKEANLKIELTEISRKAFIDANHKRSELEKELQRRIDERSWIETRLQEASREPGRKEIIQEFKALVSLLPKKMGSMQNHLNKYKEAASEVHSLRAEVRSLSSLLNRKANELKTLLGKSEEEVAEVEKLKAVVYDLKESVKELKLILEMYGRESTESRNVTEARETEYKAWAQVQSLQSSLDEHQLELRVKAANEAEAISQQRLAAAEAEIADLRQKLEASGREITKFSEVLKSKHEEGEAYLSEIETIGQAYEDMQNQNRQLLQQVTERDDYNIKLVLEGVRTKQMLDALYMEKQHLERELRQASASLDLYNFKAIRIEEQLKIYSEQVGKLGEEGWQNSVAMENIKSKLLDIQRQTQQLKQTQEGSQPKVEKSRQDVVAHLIELERERFSRRRTEEELEALTRKANHLSVHTESSSLLDKLQEEVGEYRELLKCNVCHDRQKEVVITKCYHLFCGPCIQKALENRFRKCPMCSASFGPNDVKNVYI